MFTTLGSALNLTPNPSLARNATQRGQHHTVWGGTTLSRPITVTHAPKGASHTLFKPTRAREHQPTKQAEKGGGGTTPSPTTPSKRTHPKPANTKKQTRTVAQTRNPNHPPNKHAHNKPQQVRPQANTRNAHTTTCGRNQVRAQQGNRGKAGNRHKRSTNDQRGHADGAHNKHANNPACAQRAARARKKGGAA